MWQTGSQGEEQHYQPHQHYQSYSKARSLTQSANALHLRAGDKTAAKPRTSLPGRLFRGSLLSKVLANRL